MDIGRDAPHQMINLPHKRVKHSAIVDRAVALLRRLRTPDAPPPERRLKNLLRQAHPGAGAEGAPHVQHTRFVPRVHVLVTMAVSPPLNTQTMWGHASPAPLAYPTRSMTSVGFDDNRTRGEMGVRGEV